MIRLLGVILLLTFLSANAAEFSEFLVAGAGVKLREKPESNARVRRILPFGANVSLHHPQKTGDEWVNVWFDDGDGWVAAKYLSPHQTTRRGSHYLQLARDQFDRSQNEFGNLVELLSFINGVLFDIPDPIQVKAMESLRIAVLLRCAERAKQIGNTEWLSRNAYVAPAPRQSDAPTRSASQPQINMTTGKMSPIVSNVVGNVNIIYGEQEQHKLRITYWRLKGIAADFLVKGLLSPEWEMILGGQQEILNNPVLNAARNVLSLFALEPHGDLMYSEQLRVSGSLEDQKKLRTQKDVGRNLKVFLGGQSGYSMLFPDKDAAYIVAKTDHWPSDYSLFHVCYGDVSQPILWKFMRRSELETYNQKIGDYIQFIVRSDSNISHVTGVQYDARDRRIIDALMSVTKDRLPDDFLLVLSTVGAHGGWELQFLPREIEIEIAAIENTSSRSVAIGELEYSESDLPTLMAYDEVTKRIASSPKRSTRPLVTGILKPGEKVVVPTRVSFVSTFQVKQCLSPSYKGEKVDFSGGFSQNDNFSKTRDNLKTNIYPKITPRYTYGTAWQLSALKIDGVTSELRQANFNGLNVYLSNEKGSCPFVYTRNEATGLWLGEGHVLLGATARSRSRRETKELKRVPYELKLMQHEDEITYINEIYVEERLADGEVKRHAPDAGQKQFLVSRNHEQILSFSKLSNGVGASYALTVDGYYIPLASLNFQDDFHSNGRTEWPSSGPFNRSRIDDRRSKQ